jgi:hypothetical protein
VRRFRFEKLSQKRTPTLVGENNRSGRFLPTKVGVSFKEPCHFRTLIVGIADAIPPYVSTREADMFTKDVVLEKIDGMNQELKFLWQEAHEEYLPDLKERKMKQFWDLYRVYKKQKAFLKAMVQE